MGGDPASLSQLGEEEGEAGGGDFSVHIPYQSSTTITTGWRREEEEGRERGERGEKGGEGKGEGGGERNGRRRKGEVR